MCAGRTSWKDLLTHLIFSEVSECFLFCPILLLCLAKNKVEDQANYVNGRCNEEDVSPSQLWILKAGNSKLLRIIKCLSLLVHTGCRFTSYHSSLNAAGTWESSRLLLQCAVPFCHETCVLAVLSAGMRPAKTPTRLTPSLFSSLCLILFFFFSQVFPWSYLNWNSSLFYTLFCYFLITYHQKELWLFLFSEIVHNTLA